MVTFNRVIIAGNLVRDPEISYQNSGNALTKMAVAVNERYKGADGSIKETVSFIDVVVWGKQAENCAEYLAKGRPVLVEGRLRQRRWETEGKKYSKLEVIATTVQFLGGNRQDGAPEGAEPPPEDEGPF